MKPFTEKDFHGLFEHASSIVWILACASRQSKIGKQKPLLDIKYLTSRHALERNFKYELKFNCVVSVHEVR